MQVLFVSVFAPLDRHRVYVHRVYSLLTEVKLVESLEYA